MPELVATRIVGWFSYFLNIVLYWYQYYSRCNQPRYNNSAANTKNTLSHYLCTVKFIG